MNSERLSGLGLEPVLCRQRARQLDVLNLYPQISTDPRGLDRAHSTELKVENERQIAKLIDGRQLTILAPWGGLIGSRKYFPQLLEDIVQVTDAAGCSWVSLGDPIAGGHPRHPSRARKDSLLQPFSMSGYLGGRP